MELEELIERIQRWKARQQAPDSEIAEAVQAQHGTSHPPPVPGQEQALDAQIPIEAADAADSYESEEADSYESASGEEYAEEHTGGDSEEDAIDVSAEEDVDLSTEDGQDSEEAELPPVPVLSEEADAGASDADSYESAEENSPDEEASDDEEASQDEEESEF